MNKMITLLLLLLLLYSCKKEKSMEDDRVARFNATLISKNYHLTSYYSTQMDMWELVNKNIIDDTFSFTSSTEITVTQDYEGKILSLPWKAYIKNGILYMDFYNDEYQPYTYLVEDFSQGKFILSTTYGGEKVYSGYELK